MCITSSSSDLEINFSFLRSRREGKRKELKSRWLFHETTSTGDAMMNKTGTVPSLRIKHYWDRDG